MSHWSWGQRSGSIGWSPIEIRERLGIGFGGEDQEVRSTVGLPVSLARQADVLPSEGLLELEAGIRQ